MQHMLSANSAPQCVGAATASELLRCHSCQYFNCRPTAHMQDVEGAASLIQGRGRHESMWDLATAGQTGEAADSKVQWQNETNKWIKYQLMKPDGILGFSSRVIENEIWIICPIHHSLRYRGWDYFGQLVLNNQVSLFYFISFIVFFWTSISVLFLQLALRTKMINC